MREGEAGEWREGRDAGALLAWIERGSVASWILHEKM